MTAADLQRRFQAVCTQTRCDQPLPLPAQGNTPERHRHLFDIALEDLSLAKLAEAHWDALAILAEAGRTPKPGALYAVWASEIPDQPLQLTNNRLSGTKAFCTGYGLVDRALVTLGTGDGRLLDIDLSPNAVHTDASQWQTEAFRNTNTGAVSFRNLQVGTDAVVGNTGFYLNRPGFWHGACGPAACWAGGAAGLLAFADNSKRSDPHTQAHRAAMHCNVWAMRSILDTAGREIDAAPHDACAAQARALKVRHLIEQLATDTLRRFARAYGPFPLAMNPDTAHRYHELDIFLRQSHGERDLEALARLLEQAHRSHAFVIP